MRWRISRPTEIDIDRCLHGQAPDLEALALYLRSNGPHNPAILSEIADWFDVKAKGAEWRAKLSRRPGARGGSFDRYLKDVPIHAEVAKRVSSGMKVKDAIEHVAQEIRPAKGEEAIKLAYNRHERRLRRAGN